MKQIVGNFTRRLFTTETSHAERQAISAVQKAAMERLNDNGPLAESRLKIFLPSDMALSLKRSDYGTSNVEKQLKNGYNPRIKNPNAITPEQHKETGERTAAFLASHIALSEPSDGKAWSEVYVDELKSVTFSTAVLQQIENIRPKAPPAEETSPERDNIIANIVALRHSDGPFTPAGYKLLAELESKAASWQERISSPANSVDASPVKGKQ